MTEQELERALRAALRPVDPEASAIEQIMAQIESRPEQSTRPADAVAVSAARAPRERAGFYRHWLPAAVAASLLIAFGLVQRAQLQHQRELEVRAQLLQGLSIASASVGEARSTVLHSTDSTP